MTTSDVKDAWTEDARVAVVLCGNKCDSSVQPLITDDSRALRRGRTAGFTVSNNCPSSLCYVYHLNCRKSTEVNFLTVTHEMMRYSAEM